MKQISALIIFEHNISFNIGKIIDEYLDNPREGIQKLKEKLESLSKSGKLNLLNNKTNEEIAKLALNLHVIFKNFEEVCDPGSVLRKHNCGEYNELMNEFSSHWKSLKSFF